MTIECLLTNYNQVFQKTAEYNSKDNMYMFIKYIYMGLECVADQIQTTL